MNRKQRRRWRRLYFRVWNDRIGFWAIWVVLVGLGLMTFMCAIYIPVLMERAHLLRAIWEVPPTKGV